jgi:predicted dehydrogenase
MKELGVGIVGFGFMGKTHTYAYKTMPFFYDSLPFKIKLKAVCSRRKETVQEAKEKYGFELATTDIGELYERDDIDIINICTPNLLHKEMVINALLAGKHVYCDKPLVVNNAEAGEILELLNNKPELSNLVTQVAYQNRFYPVTMRARQLIEEGAIGNPVSFRASYLHSGSVNPDKPIGWKQDKDCGGGVLADMGSHVLDMVYYLIGEYESVSAINHVLYPRRPDRNGKIINITAEDLFIMTARMKNGAVGTLEASKIATGTNDEFQVEIYGDKGALKFDLMNANWLEYYDNTVSDKPMGGRKGFTKIECVQRFEKPGGNFPPSKLSIGWLRAHVHSLYSFISCVHDGKKADPSIKEGAYIQYVMEKAFESDKLKKWVNLD